MKKILISSCVLGNKVRWNGACKRSNFIQEWAKESGFELVPICPESELFGTPRRPIKLHQVADQIMAMMGCDNVYPELYEKCKETIETHSDAVGYIGISGSPSCGIANWVRGRKKQMKGPMHELSPWPTTEINSMRTHKNREIFKNRVLKWIEENKNDQSD